MNMLENKVVIVTGAGGSIGKAIAMRMAKEGASVVVNDAGVSLEGDREDEGTAERIAREIRELGGKAAANAASVSEYEAAETIVQTAIDEFGRVDAVVNCAGILRDTFFHKMTPDEFEAVLRVHLFGTFNVSNAAARRFREQESGSLVHMTSTSGLIGSLGQANYSAAKMAIVGLSRSIAMDMERFNVRSNCIAPHAFSRMIESVKPAGGDDREAELTKRRSSTAPEQITPLIAYLCSDASSSISGQIFGARGTEIFLYNQPRPIRTLHRGEGWTVEDIAETLPKAWGSALTPLERTKDVIGWEVP